MFSRLELGNFRKFRALNAAGVGRRVCGQERRLVGGKRRKEGSTHSDQPSKIEVTKNHGCFIDWNSKAATVRAAAAAAADSTKKTGRQTDSQIEGACVQDED